jgi:predicted nucleotide-binding protein
VTSHRDVVGRLDEFIIGADALRAVSRKHMTWDLWIDEVESFLRHTLGEPVEKEFKRSLTPSAVLTFGDPQPIYLEALQQSVNKLAVIRKRVIRGDYDVQLQEGPGQTEKAAAAPASVFISHSGETPAFSRLIRFLGDLGVNPLVAEWLPFKGRTVPEHVRGTMDGCQAAVVFATAADAVGERKQPGRGALIETGILQQRFGDKVVYLVEEGAELGPMADGFAHESFTQDCLERAFHRIVVELKAHDMI